MEFITVTAKTLDDAITEALIQLGVTSDQLDYQVIEKGSAGFLGIGMKQAVIKARRKEEVKEEEPEIELPKVDISLVKEPVKREEKKEYRKEKEGSRKESGKPSRTKKTTQPGQAKQRDKKNTTQKKHAGKRAACNGYTREKRGTACKSRGSHNRGM